MVHLVFSFEMLSNEFKKAELILEDGTHYEGYSFGYDKSTAGEIVFNTGMVGYTESLTDPSYKGQILTLTYPLVGNYGISKSDFESDKIQVEALIVSEFSKEYSHWNSTKSLQEWLKENKIPAVFGIDTRELTKKIRDNGTMLGKIIIDEKDVKIENPNKRNLVEEVSIDKPIIYDVGSNKNVILIDCGTKQSIIDSFLKRNVNIIRVPWNYDIFKYKFDGVVISNGPGDPKMCGETIKNVKKVIDENIPIFGICLGNQLLALAAGGDTYKLRYGHRGQNQPCVEVGSKRFYVTSQNHGFAVNADSLSSEWKPWFINTNDNTNEGIQHKTNPFISVQFHPESSPGPFDTQYLFDKFLKVFSK